MYECPNYNAKLTVHFVKLQVVFMTAGLDLVVKNLTGNKASKLAIIPLGRITKA